MIYALEIGFALLNIKIELLLSSLTKFLAKSIKKSIVHIILSINTCKTKNLSTNINSL